MSETEAGTLTAAYERITGSAGRVLQQRCACCFLTCRAEPVTASTISVDCSSIGGRPWRGQADSTTPVLMHRQPSGATGFGLPPKNLAQLGARHRQLHERTKRTALKHMNDQQMRESTAPFR